MTMLKQLEIKLSLNKSIEDDEHIHPRKLSSLPKLLSQKFLSFADKSYLNTITDSPIQPYSSYVLFDEDIITWRISGLNTQAVENMIYPFKENLTKEISLDNNIELAVQSCNYIHSATYQQFIEKYFANTCRVKAIKYSFLTAVPLSIQKDTQFLTCLETKILLQDLLNKWNTFAEANTLIEDDLADKLAEQTYILDYNFQLRPYTFRQDSHEKIPAFTGDYLIGLKSNVILKKIICILSDYAVYTGFGNNTINGMGAMQSKVYNRLIYNL